MKCKAITNAGRPCASRAAPDGFCGGHGPNHVGTGRPPMPLPMEEIASRYENGETAKSLGVAFGIAEATVIYRLRRYRPEAIRRPGCREGLGPKRYQWLSSDEVLRLWNEGLLAPEIARRLGIGLPTVYARIREARGGAEGMLDDEIRRLYVEEELSVRMVAKRVRRQGTAIRERLIEMGVDRRTPSDWPHDQIARNGSLRALQLAAYHRRHGRQGPGWEGMSLKQRDLLDILRAAPEPLTVRRIIEVAEYLPRRWRANNNSGIYGCLKGLRHRRLVATVETIGHESPRGRRVLWFPASEEISEARSLDDAQRLREIQMLVDDQQRDDHDWVKSTGALSLNAPISEDGLTLLDALASSPDWEPVA